MHGTVDGAAEPCQKDQRELALRRAWQSSRLGHLPAELQSAMLSEATELKLGRGEILQWEDRILALVVSGRVCAYLTSGDRRVAIRYYEQSDVLGLPTIVVRRQPSSAWGFRVVFRATEATRLIELQADRLRAAAQQDGSTAWMLSEWLAEDAIASRAAFADHIFLPVSRRLARHLLDLAQHEDGLLVVRATQEELAKSIGSVRAVVARASAELRQDNLIARCPGGFVLLNPDALHSFARRDARVSASLKVES